MKFTSIRMLALFAVAFLTLAACSAQQLATAQNYAHVACISASTGQMILAVADPKLLASPDAQKAQAAVSAACAAVNALPTPAVVPATVTATPSP